MLTFTVALPLGHPAGNLPVADRNQAVQNFDAALQSVTGGPFGPNATRLVLNFGPTVLPVTALWTGEITQVPGSNLFAIELQPAQARDLEQRIAERQGSGYPVPRSVVFGPVALKRDVLDTWLRGIASKNVVAGENIGALAAVTLEFGFLDAAGRYIDPFWCLSLFDALEAWDLPSPGANPLQASAAMPQYGALLTPGGPPGPSVTLRTASGHTRFVRPPAAVQSSLASFLTSELITVGLVGAPAGTRWRLRVEDLSNSQPQPFVTAYGTATEVSFTPANDLPSPFVARPHFRLTVELESLTSTLPAFQLLQDDRDALRQEYSNASLSVPPRKRLGFVGANYERFNVAHLYANDDYFSLARIGLDPFNLPHFAECLSHAFERAMHPAGLPASDPRNWTTSDLLVVDGYHSPGRHRTLMPSVPSHASQYACYLKVRPRADRQQGALFRALTGAGIEQLQELRALNSGRNFIQLELRLLDTSDEWLWTWRVGSGGAVTSQVASGGAASLPPDEDAAYLLGGSVELFFLPDNPATALLMPPARPKVDAAPEGKLSLIMIGAEAPGATARIPIDDSAHTMREWLRLRYDRDLEPVIAVVSSPIEVLTHLGVIGDQPIDFRFVITMTHSYGRGLLIYHLGPTLTPQADGWLEPYVHSDVVEDQMRDLYGNAIGFGQDDVNMYATHQFRISNLKNLPDDMKRRLRRNFAKAEGTFLIGCNSNADIGEMTLSEAVAEYAGVTTWGASDFSTFVKKAPPFGWLDHDQERGVGTVGEFEVVLLPDDPGFTLAFDDLALLDLIGIYKQGLVKAVPGVQ